MWKLFQDGSGLILESFGIDSGPLLFSKVTVLILYHIINSPNEKMSLFNFKYHHLVINPDPGPFPKCAPGHDSIKDLNMIKSYRLKVGLIHFQNRHTSI